MISLNATSQLSPTGQREGDTLQPALACKLTSAALQLRKETVIRCLKDQVLERKELEDGFAYKFQDSDTLADALTEFIKTERACCDFFQFELASSDDKSEIWLKITGPDGAKQFIETELTL